MTKFSDYDPPPIDLSPEKIAAVAQNAMELESSFKARSDNLETLKNRDAYPIGTRVKLAFHKIDITYGIVTEYSENDGRMFVMWDGQRHPAGPYENYELKAVKRNYVVTMRDYKISFTETYEAINEEDAVGQSLDQYPTSRFVSCEEQR
jgi:hypothetical protein